MSATVTLWDSPTALWDDPLEPWGTDAAPILWPEVLLPWPRRGGNQRNPADRSIRAGMANGPQVARQRHYAPRESAPVTLALTADQFAVWDGFWENTLRQGSAWVYLPLRGESGLAWFSVRFSEGYQASLDGDRWTVTATVEIDIPARLE